MAQFGEEAIAGMAIIGRLVPISFGALFALSGAVGPIIGQNFGAGRHDRVRTAFASAVLFAALFVTGMSLILFLLRDPIAGLFNAEGMTLTLIYLFCGPLALAFFFNGLMFVSNAAYNNLGHPFYSTWSNWGRHTLGTIPFAMLGAAWFGAPGVLIGAYSGGLIFGLGSTLLALRLMKQNETPSDRPPFQRQARLLALFNLRR
jgi:MATE family, multidrug efflux pump